MSSIFSPDPSNFKAIIRSASRELDSRQLAVFARLTPTRRLELMFEICAFAQQMLIASERQRHPTASEEELAQYVRARIQMGYAT